MTMNPKSNRDYIIENRGEHFTSDDFSDPESVLSNVWNPAISYSNARSYLPEITRQMLLDTSDSEFERVGPALLTQTRDVEGYCGFSKNPKPSSQESRFSRQSSVGCSKVKPIRSRSDRENESSREPSDVPGPANKLRFIPSPNPDMIHRSGSESSNLESNAEFRSSRKPSSNIEVASNPGSSGSNSYLVADSLPKSRFTYKTSSNVFGYPTRSLNTHDTFSVRGNPARDPHGCVSVGTSMPCRGIADRHQVPPSNTSSDHSGTAYVANFENSVRSSYQNLGSQCKRLNSSESSMGRFLEDVAGRHDFGFRSSSSSQMASDPPSSRIDYTDPNGLNFGQRFFPRPISHSHTEVEMPGLCRCHDVGPGSPKNAQTSHAASYNSRNNPFSPQTIAHQTATIKSETGLNPAFSERSSHSSSNVPVGRSSQNQESGLGIVNIAAQACNLQSEHVRSDIVSGRSGTEAADLRDPSASSHTPASQTSTTSVGRVQSNHSYLQVNVGSSNHSSGSTGFRPSDRTDVNSSSNQEHQISSCDSGIVIMSLIYKKNKIAGSSYNTSTGQVHLLESISENLEFRTAVLALRSATPSIVVVPSSGATRFVKELKTKLEGDVNLRDCQFQCLSPRYFAYGFARRTVIESSLWEGCLTFRSEDAKKNAIVSNINLNDERLVCAFGGLLYHLSTGNPQLEAGMSPSPIISVQHMKLSNKLWVDTESLRNLQIFDPVEHPSSFNWYSANRDDGKSIFSLFERFCSSVGMTKLKAFLANPVNCRRVLEKRHDVMNFYLNHSNFNAVEALRSFASQMSSSSVIMSYLSSPTLRGGQWKHIYRHIYYTVSYAEVCRSHGDQSELFRELGSTIVDAVYSMAHNLERVVDLVNMENNETFVIKYGFHPPLDAAKEKFSRLKTAMDKVTPYEFDSVPSFITRIQMMYIPEMKFLLSIPYWAQDLSKGDLLLPNLEFKFTANKTAFYKSRRCYELDELLGDAQTDIINEESMIIQSLRNYLKKHMHHIVGMVQKISEIECIFALAKVAQEERYSKPEIMESCIIDIRGGWHPLLDVPSTHIITNNTISSSNTSLVKLIYGPNASGKSIYLKQVGLIMYLVHVGSFVPAASAKVGLFSRILARTTKEESVISMSSTMLSELKKLHDSVSDCSKDSLIILDEVGKGSSEINCIAIVTSALNYFLSHGSDSPHVLVSTHLSGISDFVTSPARCDESTSLFELLLMDYTVADDEIVFLYKIHRGNPDGSFVFEVLENSEFAAPIIKMAKSVLEALRTGENFLPYCETRIQRSHKYLNFIRKFVNIDMAKPGYLEKLQNKIQRYYEKPS